MFLLVLNLHMTLINDYTWILSSTNLKFQLHVEVLLILVYYLFTTKGMN